MLFFEFLFQTPAVINIEDRVGEISALNQFGPTVEGFLRGLLFGAALLAFFYMLWGALDWILSGGDSGKVESARKKITQALIGLAVMACVGVLFLVVQSFLGIEILTTSPTPVSEPACGPGRFCPTK